MIALLNLGLLLAATVIGSFGPVFLKKATLHLKRDAFRSISGFLRATLLNGALVLGVFFYGAGLVFYLLALHGSDLSIVYPLVSLSYIWVCLLSVGMLGERMSGRKWLAVAFIILGAVLVGFGS
ncbi:MAG TPA: EamA family transporter [Candidatus Binatia bacterium]|nr:EamA family transporter [Candidatus Binatia bacterium]